jgi:hypothetical protein
MTDSAQSIASHAARVGADDPAPEMRVVAVSVAIGREMVGREKGALGKIAMGL